MIDQSSRFLIVDDSPVLLEIVYKFLIARGYAQIEKANDGDHALVMLKHAANEGRPFQYLLTDIVMPRMDGLTLLEECKKDPHLQELKVVIISAENDVKTISKGMALGASGFLIKPIEENALFEMLESVHQKIKKSPPIEKVHEREKEEKNFLDRILNRFNGSQENAKLDALVRALPGFAFWISKDLQFCEINNNLRAKYNIDPEAVLDLEFRKEIFNHFTGEFSKEIEVEVQGKKIFFELLVQRYEKNNEAIIFGLNITERKILEQKVADANTKSILSSKMAALGEMASGIAHEINNPLTIIYGKASLMRSMVKRNEYEPERFSKHLDLIESTAMRISKIIKGLKTFSRSEEKDPFTVHKLIKIFDDVMVLCTEKFRKNQVELFLPEIPENFELNCHPAEISQVIINVFNNAVDAIAEMNVEKWVKVSLEKSIYSSVIIKITDCGNGIPLEIQNKMMQPFFTTKDVGKGTGLGLSISKGIIEAHGGKLSIDSESKNTTFVIELPLYQQKAEEILKRSA